MMAIRVRPGVRKTRLMSRTSNVRKAEWDQVRGNHQGQRQDRLINRPDTGLYLTTLAETSKSPCIAGAIHTGHSIPALFRQYAPLPPLPFFPLSLHM